MFHLNIFYSSEERQKTGLDGSSNTTWLRGWFSGGVTPAAAAATTSNDLRRPRTSSSEVSAATGLDQSLAKAFIAFLETESMPKSPPILLPVSEMAERRLSQTPTPDSRRNSMSGTPPMKNATPPLMSSVTPPIMPSSIVGRQSPNPLLAQAGGGLGGGQEALPTFSMNRSFSAILKDVLQEEQPQQLSQQPSQEPPPPPGNNCYQ